VAKTGWPVKTLGEIITLAYGRPLDAKDRDENGAIPVYGANGVKARSKRSLVEGPSIIVGRKGSAGELNFCSGPFWPLDVTYYVEHDVKETDLRFLYFLLSLLDLPRLAKGVKPGINRNEVYGLTTQVPPLEEQKRIVALLDDATAHITELTACYERARTQANNFFTSALRDALESNPDWPIKTLGEVAVLNPSEPPLSEDAPFVPMDAVTAGKRRVQYTQPRGQRSGARARAGDILFARITPCLQNGKVALIQDEIERCGGSTEFIVVRAGPDVLRGFLYQWITAEHVRDHLTALMKGTTGRQRLDARDLALTELPVPPLEEQKRIVARLDQMRAKTAEMVAAYDAKLQAAKNLRQSILEAAFGGEL
jgi:type I restriction enzyme S subunit